MGTPMEIDPLDALLWCIRITAGEIQWLSDRMADLQEDDFIENTLIGKQFNIHARERRMRMQDLAKYSSMAVSLGIAERRVRLSEQYGELLARYTKGILEDLQLTPEQLKLAPTVVRRHLIAISGGLDGVVEQPAIPETVEGKLVA